MSKQDLRKLSRERGSFLNNTFRKTNWQSYLRFLVFNLSFLIIFIGCGGGGGSTTTNQKTISGYVIDDPIVGATIEVYDKDGNLLTKEENATDSNGYFSVNINKLNSSVVKITALPQEGTPLSAYVNLSENNEPYVTQYTTALIDNAIIENKNVKDEYFNLLKKLNFSSGIPTDNGSYEYKKINYIASKIHNSFKNKTSYNPYDDSNLTVSSTRSLLAGSVIDFSLEGYTNLTCDNSSLVNIDNTKLNILDDINETTDINCVATGKDKFKTYIITLTPNNTTKKEIKADQKSIEYNGMQISKPSNDVIEVQSANNAPVVLKNGSDVIAGNTLLNLYPDGKVLEKPLTVQIPSAEQNQTFYLLSKDGSLEKANSTYASGVYTVTIPHFTRLIKVDQNILRTSTELVNSKDYDNIKNLLIDKDKKYYTFSKDLSYPTMLTYHGYTVNDLKNNKNVEALLAILLLHNGKGIIDFDGTNINFNGGTLKFGVTNEEAAKNDDSSQLTSSFVNTMIKIFQMQAIFIQTGLDATYVENNKQYLQKLSKKDIYKKRLTDLYNKSGKYINDYNAYISKLNDIEAKYQTSQKTFQDIENALKEYDKLANANNKTSYGQGYKNVNFTLMALKQQQKLLENLTTKSLDYINHNRDTFLKHLKYEIQQTKEMMDNFKKTNSPLKISDKTELLINNLYKNVNNEEALSNFLKKSKSLQVIEPVEESHFGDNFGKIFGAAGLALKVWSITSTYNFKEIDNKIKFLNKIKPYLSNSEKSDINDLIQRLIYAKVLDKNYLSSVFAYLDNIDWGNLNNLGDIANFLDSTNDMFTSLSLSTRFTSLIEKGLKGTLANTASLLSILNTAGQVTKTWKGGNSLAYISATSATLANELAHSAKTPKERLDYYCLFQTISAASLRGWYYYSAGLANKLFDSSGSTNKFYVIGTLLDAGLSVVSNPNELGEYDALFKLAFNEQVIGALWSMRHGNNSEDFLNKLASLEDKQVSDIVMRTAEYKNIVNGVFDSVFSHKRDLIIPITQQIELPDGKKLLSFYIKLNDLDRISIRFDRKDSNTYMEDVANKTNTQAAEIGYKLDGNTYAKYSIQNNELNDESGLIVDPNGATLVTVVVGKNIDRIEILGWKKDDTDNTIPYMHTIKINATVNADSSRINDLENNLQNKIDFDNPNSVDNAKYLLDNKFTVINLDTNKTINNTNTLTKTKNWIALKYYNAQMYSIALVKSGSKLYYFIRDNVFDINTGDIGDLFGGSIDFSKMFTLKYPIASLRDDIDIASKGAFSAISLDDLFPNLENGIDDIEGLYGNEQLTDKTTLKCTLQKICYSSMDPTKEIDCQDSKALHDDGWYRNIKHNCVEPDYTILSNNTIKVTVKDSNGKQYSKSASFDITKQSPNYTLSFLGENYKDGTTLNVSDQDSISKYWSIKNISNHSAHLILEKDSAKTCNLTLMTTTDNKEEFDLPIGKSDKFIHNYQMPTKDGTYTCYYKIKDDKGNYYKIGNASDISINVKIVSNPLFVNSDFDSEIKVGSSATMIVQINNGNAPYSYKIDWGDDQTTDTSNSNANSTFTHLYNSVGTYTVKVNITDKTGKSYSKTYTLKVSENVSKVTKWSGYIDEVKKTGGNTGDITKNITIQNTTYDKKTVNSYSIPYTKASDDTLYYTGYKLPVPQGLINLDKKVRVTFVTKIDTTTGYWNYDREFWLKTDSKKYGSVIEDAKDGQNDNGVFIVKDLSAGTRTDTNVSDFIDFVVENKGVSTYALEIDKDAITTYSYAKGSDGNYTYKVIHSYPDDTGDYLSQIHVDFKGSGDIILAYLQYDKNGNGKFDSDENIILNTADGSVDWSKIGESSSKDTNQTTGTSTIKKTGQTKSYDTNGNEVTDGSLKDDGYYQKGVTPSYTRDDTKQIVTDNITKLQWQDNEEAKTVTKDWQDAKDYCSALVLGGYNDWRLPTAKELEGIVDYGKSYPAIDTIYFKNVSSSDYWSSTTNEDGKDYAWFVSFYLGYVNNYNKDYNYYVRCVRDGQ